MKFFEFDQNNSGGSFITDNLVCHRVVIEAKTYAEARDKALNLGVYFDGCAEGMDCYCCGDRWYDSEDIVDLTKINAVGYSVDVFLHSESVVQAEKEWIEKYGKYELHTKPKWQERYSKSFECKITFRSIEEYMQFLADEYGWTDPDARIYYADGTVKEIFMNHKENEDDV